MMSTHRNVRYLKKILVGVAQRHEQPWLSPVATRVFRAGGGRERGAEDALGRGEQVVTIRETCQPDWAQGAAP